MKNTYTYNPKELKERLRGILNREDDSNNDQKEVDDNEEDS